MPDFELISNYKPQGDQPTAINKLVEGLYKGDRFQTLLGVTGSGKTYTMAQIINSVNRPVLVMSPNKTLAAQLCNEFKEFFPKNSVHYFVSYYDYYQPEAYVPTTDTYIEKDASINEQLERLRLSSTNALLTRRDVIIVASVSCIFNLGSPSLYKEKTLILSKGEKYERDEILLKLVKIKYQRNDIDFSPGTFRVKGDIVDIFPPYNDYAIRIELFGDDIKEICKFNYLTGEIIEKIAIIMISPATHFVIEPKRMEEILFEIEKDLDDRLKELKSQDKLLEVQRLRMRTKYDLEMLKEIGYCKGIENYSRYFSGREPGATPSTLLNYFPDDFITFIDESHIAVPQINGMYHGDRSRKETLIEYGFRLPSALDNRPLRMKEFLNAINQVIFVSATPRDFEIENSSQVVEQIIRPTGLVDPEVEVRKTTGQIDNLMTEIKKRTTQNERVLITTLTKRMAENLTDYFLDMSIKSRYLHSEIGTLERVKIIRELRKGDFDVLVGINLLREGLDLPEVSLVAILDADKEGFLRSETSLIQTIGRASRNIRGKVIMYADNITRSMKRAIDETNRRRDIQLVFNEENNIEPQTIHKKISDILMATKVAEKIKIKDKIMKPGKILPDEIPKIILGLEEEMRLAAEELNFEYAAILRDQIKELKKQTKY
ncbi:MAG: excinuclease ABC subunit UvrB [Actinobacteria bacterium]|nr:excinuclease ABC subunit UvrB [Actinomycetota bacterium]